MTLLVVLETGGDALEACPEYNPDHVQQALDRLTSPVCNDTQQALLSVLAERWQQIEDVATGMVVFRLIDTAEGVNLDQIGSIYGVEREGRGDEEYRTLIKCQTQINRSSGTVDEILSILCCLVGTEDASYWPSFPAGYSLDFVSDEVFDVAYRRRVVASLLKATPSGVRFDGVVQAPSDYFGFATDPNALGFGDGLWSNDWLND